MRSRKPKNKGWLLRLGLALLLMAPAFYASGAQAYTFYEPEIWNPANNRVCPIDLVSDSTHYEPAMKSVWMLDHWQSVPDMADTTANRALYGFTKRIVICVKETVLSAISIFLADFSAYIANTVAAVYVLAVCFWGLMLMMGKASAPVKDVFVLVLKIGFVIAFVNNFAGLYPLILDSMDFMLGMVSGYFPFSSFAASGNCPIIDSPPVYQIWDRVDCALEVLVGGIFSSFTLASGLIGFTIAALVSSSVGAFIGMTLLILIFQMILAIAKAVYIFLTSYLAFALMVLISPIFIPLILFRATQAYFEKWLKTTLGFIIQPIFLFAFLAMMLTVFDEVVYSGNTSLFRAMVGTVVDGDLPYWDDNSDCIIDSYVHYDPADFRLGDWLAYSFVYADKSVGSYAVGVDWKDVLAELGPPGSVDTGITGEIATQVGEFEWDSQAGIFNLPPFNTTHFPVDASVQAIDFKWLACNNGYDQLVLDEDGNQVYDAFGNPKHEGNVIEFVVPLIMSCIMALVMVYIFMTLLDYLPFLGTAISGDTLSLPTFGEGTISPPIPKGGDVKKLANRIAGSFSKGGN